MAYSDAFKAKAIVRLAVNDGNHSKTAEELGVSKSTLCTWSRAGIRTKKDIAEMLEDALGMLLSNVPSKIDGKSWGIAVGILMDKWLLMRGDPTQRTETRNIDQRTRDDVNDVLREADRILAEEAQQESG